MIDIPRKRRFPRQPLSFQSRLAVIFGLPVEMLIGLDGTTYATLQRSEIEEIEKEQSMLIAASYGTLERIFGRTT